MHAHCHSIIATQEPECTGCIRCKDGLLHILHDAYTGFVCVNSAVYAFIIHNYKQLISPIYICSFSALQCLNYSCRSGLAVMIKLACMEDPKGKEKTALMVNFCECILYIICLGCAEDIYTALFSLYNAWV